MLEETYDLENQLENNHWWFCGRRSLLIKAITGMGSISSDRVLDVGCGTGANLSVLNAHGFKNLYGVDVNSDALNFCQAKVPSAKLQKANGAQLPFCDDQFDVVVCMDILEHVDNHDLFVAELYRVLKPKHYCIVTVPAFGFLWGVQDVVGQHKRRYTKQELRALLQCGGFQIYKIYYFNFLLFFPIFVFRLLFKVFNIPIRSENKMTPGPINLILKYVFALDVMVAPFISPPFGVSVFALAYKDNVKKI